MPDSSWTILFYKNKKGESPIEKFLDTIHDPKALEAVVDAFDLIEEFGVGPHLGRLCKHIKDDIWELRPDRIRLFYFTYTGRHVVILHGYYKQSRKAPKHEIDIALRRWREWIGQ